MIFCVADNNDLPFQNNTYRPVKKRPCQWTVEESFWGSGSTSVQLDPLWQWEKYQMIWYLTRRGQSKSCDWKKQWSIEWLKCSEVLKRQYLSQHKNGTWRKHLLNQTIENGAQQLNWKKLKWKTRILASSFLWEGEQWAFCGASTSSPNKRASLDEEAEKLERVKNAPPKSKRIKVPLLMRRWRNYQRTWRKHLSWKWQ